MAGSSYFEEGAYEEAAEQFMHAYRLSERAALLLNASSAYERASRFDDAAETLEQYLAVTPEDDAQRATLTTRLERIRARAEEQRAREAELAEAQRLRDEAAQTSEPEPQVVTTPEPSASETGGGLSGLGWTGVGVAGGGAALGIVSLITGLVAHGRHSDLEDICGATGDACPVGSQGDIDAAQRMARTSTATFFTSLALMGGGVALILVGRDDGDGDPGEVARTLRVGTGPGDVGLSVGGTF